MKYLYRKFILFAFLKLKYFLFCLQGIPVKINIGSSGNKYKNWIRTEKEFLNLIDEKTWEKIFKKNSINAILAEHVWEHLSEEEGQLAGKICFKYLGKGGYLRVAVPDGFHPDEKYIESVKPGGNGCGADDHKVLYNYKSFKRIFKIAGFEIELLEYFDEDGIFHFNDWSPDEGMIKRSKRFDERNGKDNLAYTSIIMDCYKT